MKSLRATPGIIAKRHSVVNYNVLWFNTADKARGRRGKSGKEPIMNRVNRPPHCAC